MTLHEDMYGLKVDQEGKSDKIMQEPFVSLVVFKIRRA